MGMVSVNPINNYLRVFKLPRKFSEQLSSKNGSSATQFDFIDGFQPLDDWDYAMDGAYLVDENEFQQRISKKIKNSEYYDPNRKYLILTDFEISFVI